MNFRKLPAVDMVFGDPSANLTDLPLFVVNIGIKHSFSCINVCQVPREVLKTEAEGCYCIISTKCYVTFAKNVALYFGDV